MAMARMPAPTTPGQSKILTSNAAEGSARNTIPLAAIAENVPTSTANK